MKYWQIAAGAVGRDYSRDFLRYGMAFVGGDNQEKTMGKVKEGDCVILKRGLSEILAAGIVEKRDGRVGGNGDKKWLDYDGWELPAYCFVQWHVPTSPIKDINGLTRSTIQLAHNDELIQAANELLKIQPPAQIEPEPIWDDGYKLSDDEIFEALIYQGLSPTTVQSLTSAFARIRWLAHYYFHHCDTRDIHEHETRTFLVTPLLLALGWSEQQLKIEFGIPGGRVDLACFVVSFPRSGRIKYNLEDCVLIIETKGFETGLDYAPEQIKAYARRLPACQALIVTNGLCYKAFKREKDGFPERPTAYLNLLKLTKKYPLDPGNVDGGVEVLQLLLPHAYRISGAPGSE